MELGDLFDTRNGYTPSKGNTDYWNQKDVPWFRMEDIRENGRVLDAALQYVSRSAVKGNAFPANSLIVSTSATIGEHALITCPFLANQRFTCMVLKDEWKNVCNMKYLFYYCYKLDAYCKSHLNQGNFASVDMSQFTHFIFALPALKAQERIVAILDRFDALCNDMSKGIPAEVEARKKQYEYYRDKLLSFAPLS